jgi:hypothetical protein
VSATKRRTVRRRSRSGTRRRLNIAAAVGSLGAVLLSASLVTACTGSPPEILEVLWEVRLEEDREKDLVFETLSLFIKPSDPDGSEDLEELYVIHDAAELFWHLDPDSWVQSGSGQDLWIGTNAFRLPDGSQLPEGEYRILLRDAGGEAAEQTIRVEAPSLEEARRHLPKVTIEEETIQLDPADIDYTLWLYSLDDAYVASAKVEKGSQFLGALRATYPVLQPGFRLKVYSRVDQLNLGVITGPYTVSP